MAYSITVSSAKESGELFALTTTPLIVGSADTCEIVINDPYVSSRHIEFWEDKDENPFVRDMNSTNGTTRNGSELNAGEPVLLSNGDRIELAEGKVVILVAKGSPTASFPSTQAKTRGSLPEGTLTFLFTDIVGSKDLVRNLGDIRSRELFRAHDEILRNTISDNQGYVVKEQGDGFMAVFSSSRLAIVGATKIQSSIRDLRGKEADIDVYLRIGINTGEAILENDDYFGRAVNEVARICAQAESDEIIVSSTSKTMADSAGDIKFGDSRKIQLKGLPGTHLVYSVIWEN
mgnify:CR=1 FL=1|tara:strand:+ start:107 stop:976 length:870 start_codon:yes stop_codon:yes gene_type:complete